MRRRTPIFGFLFLTIFSFSIVRADWHFIELIYDETILFETYPTPFPHHWEVHFNFTENDKLVFSFNVSDIVEFWISDEVNYDKFKFSTEAGYPYTCYSIYNYLAPATDYSGEFIIPKSDVWYFTFINEYSPYENRTIELVINLYRWQEPFNPITAWGPLFLSTGLILASLITLVVFFRYKRVQ